MSIQKLSYINQLTSSSLLIFYRFCVPESTMRRSEVPVPLRIFSRKGHVQHQSVTHSQQQLQTATQHPNSGLRTLDALQRLKLPSLIPNPSPVRFFEERRQPSPPSAISSAFLRDKGRCAAGSILNKCWSLRIRCEETWSDTSRSLSR